MPSTAEPPGDPGLARERTALAWQRMALSFTSLAAVMLAAAAHRQRLWFLAPAALLFAVGAAIWLYARRRTGDPALFTARRPVALLSGAAVAAAVAAGVLSAFSPG
jgi:uncharacterized membrane protein YidH (DUF202 family)